MSPLNKQVSVAKLIIKEHVIITQYGSTVYIGIAMGCPAL